MIIDMTDEDAEELQKELGLTIHNSCIGYNETDDDWHVYIFDKVKKPPMITWKGRQIRYSIGGGMPVAYGGSGILE